MWSGIHHQRQRESCSTTAEISERWIEPGQLVLDVGCGEGAIAQSCRKQKDVVVVCVELSVARIREAHRKGLQAILSDAMTLPFRSMTFDAAMCHLLLEFVPNPYKALEEIRRTLKTRGTLIVSVPNHANLYEIVQCVFKPRQYSDYLTRHLNLYGYTPPYLFTMLNRTGYSIDQVVGFVSSLGQCTDTGMSVRTVKWMARKIQSVVKLPLAFCETIIVKAMNTKQHS